jgi:hypothetical protein
MLYTIAVGSALLVLYLLSTGPFCWLQAHDYISPEQGIYLRNTIYAPITWCFENSTTGRIVIDAWAQWWKSF